MRAAYIEQTGAPDVIRVGDLPTPEPGPGELLIRVGAAAINPIDLYMRSGAVPSPMSFPHVIGCDMAGTVEKLGQGVGRIKVGDRVWCSNQGMMGRQGVTSEYAAVSEEWLYPTPESLTDAEAASMALVGITAHLGLFACAKLKAGETVFVNGGTGGVGMMVIQMAKAAGAKVITTVGSDEKATLARELGADTVINYKTEDVHARVKEASGGAGVQVWYETQPPGDLDRTIEVMAPRGRIVVMAGRTAKPTFTNGPFYVKGLSLFGFAMFNMTPDEQRAAAEDLNRWTAAGKLRAVVGQRFPLKDTAAAHRLQEENTLQKAGTLTGKIVIQPNG